jgi:hypothetical protein
MSRALPKSFGPDSVGFAAFSVNEPVQLLLHVASRHGSNSDGFAPMPHKSRRGAFDSSRIFPVTLKASQGSRMALSASRCVMKQTVGFHGKEGMKGSVGLARRKASRAVEEWRHREEGEIVSEMLSVTPSNSR